VPERPSRILPDLPLSPPPKSLQLFRDHPRVVAKIKSVLIDEVGLKVEGVVVGESFLVSPVGRLVLNASAMTTSGARASEYISRCKSRMQTPEQYRAERVKDWDQDKVEAVVVVYE
jgi:hypothetical protein